MRASAPTSSQSKRAASSLPLSGVGFSCGDTGFRPLRLFLRLLRRGTGVMNCPGSQLPMDNNKKIAAREAADAPAPVQTMTLDEWTDHLHQWINGEREDAPPKARPCPD
jgi:hypothetical protein